MVVDAKTRVTEIVAGVTDPARGRVSAQELFSLVYDELLQLAGRLMRRERPGHTLEPTALVHEAYLKLVDQDRVSWQGRTHFRAVAAQAMRRLLVDHARGRGREKRGGAWQRVTLPGLDLAQTREGLDRAELLSLHDAIEKLSHLDQRQARIVELRFFGGLSVGEVAEALGVSRRTVEGDWTHARAWLRRELSTEAG